MARMERLRTLPSYYGAAFMYVYWKRTSPHSCYILLIDEDVCLFRLSPLSLCVGLDLFLLLVRSFAFLSTARLYGVAFPHLKGLTTPPLTSFDINAI